VYASPERLYVSTSAWNGPLARTSDIAVTSVGDGSTVTDIHAFDTIGTANATYVASGRVEGTVLNQYSMSESDGVLRVALTTGNWNAGESGIVTLRPEGRELRKIGEVWGLGPGETIRSVRYIADTAYVVTFRQTDPFYVVDVADPAAPKVLGELKVPGFSSYLHPVGDKLVLGVGSDATDDGRITGSKISLYDVSNPTAPTELDTWTTQNMAFSVEYDPHSFTWDSARSIAYVTYTNACFAVDANCAWDGNGGALAIGVRAGELVELARLTHDNRTPVSAPPTIPETTVPETTVPETTVPETTVPKTTVPETTDAPPTTTVEGGGSAGSASASSSATPADRAPVPDVSIPVIVQPVSPVEPGYPGEWKMPITRAFPLGDRVVTWSFWGVGIFAADGYALTGFAAF
ncbi:MAG: hypothetical protein GX868_12415, partial [Actinobacteria bacterium]|nr:hypothetical protein [Actinomycetota bacterium]